MTTDVNTYKACSVLIIKDYMYQIMMKKMQNGINLMLFGMLMTVMMSQLPLKNERRKKKEKKKKRKGVVSEYEYTLT